MCCMRTAMDVSNEASSEVQPLDVASFAVGDTFSSYDDLKKKLAEFEKSHSVQLTQRDSRTLEAAARRVPKRVKNANTALVYYSISFSFYCDRCTRPISDDTQSSLVCECCLGWFHFQCLGIKQPPKAKLWFCRKCCATAQGQ